MTKHTLFAKVWNEHVITELAAGVDLIHIDRHLLHDLGGGEALGQVIKKGMAVISPELTFATADHVVETRPGRVGGIAIWADDLIGSLRTNSALSGIRMFDVGQIEQGIVHVIGPELGLTLPGVTVVCGDSHTCTHGAFGAIAFGIGASDVEHVLATQALPQRRPKTMQVDFVGALPDGVTAKDMVLALISQIGTAGGTGYAIEFTGESVRSMGMEDRMTMCSLSIEAGAKTGIIAPDEITLEWLKDRPYAPKGVRWQQAVTHWHGLITDPGATYDAKVTIDCSQLAPFITWGTSPEHAIRVDQMIPDPADAPDDARRKSWTDALAYMGLEPGQAIAGTLIHRVFIGSCTNSRITDLRRAARVVNGRKVAEHVQAWVVPGSEQTKRDAEAEGLDKIFLAAGMHWREPGCSICGAANGEVVAPGERCISTSNRNFIGRQGPGSRTHLASPEMAAAAAILGVVVDFRSCFDA